MNRFVKLLFVLIIPFLLVNCPKHEDKITRNALITFALNCKGGSTSACVSGCNPQCGVAEGGVVTTDNLSCISSCQTTCASDCNLGNTILLYLASHPLKK